ncbi:hypothetical protein K7432_011285 [Basidiobolus ranarum]|uniref:BCAS3 WD40 domain-containing protein n=1 Tax=Basidiobolus ranarum TaxID=34480 RepID=A0ABR2VU64_9FUNG
MSKNPNSKVGNRAEPKYLREISSFENISTLLYGISNYVSNNLPETLSRMKKGHSQQIEGSVPAQNTSHGAKQMVTNKRRPVTCASFDWIWGVFSNNSSISTKNDTSMKLQRRLCLMLGYEDGFQIWDILNVNDIREIFSYRQENQRVTCIKSLPEPRFRKNILDEFKGYRTLIAVVSEGTIDNEDYSMNRKTSKLDFFSLKTHTNIKTIEYKLEELMDIKCNDNTIVLAFKPNKLLVLSPYTLTAVTVIENGISNPMTAAPVVALGDRLLAYATSSRAPIENPSREFVDRVYQVEKAAKSMVHSVKAISGLGYKTLSSYFSGSLPQSHLNIMGPKSQGVESDAESKDNSKQDKPSGMVIVKDTSHLNHTTLVSDKPLHHFRAHNHRIAVMTFNHSGNLLATASTQGTSFKVFEINNNGLVNNIYKLSRGYTFASVEDITFSIDSKWLAVSTGRGTTHVFAINPYGGHTNVDSHIRTCIANERGRFNRRSFINKAINLTPATRLKPRVMQTESEDKSNTFCSESNINGDNGPAFGKTAPQVVFIVGSQGPQKTKCRRGSNHALPGRQKIYTFNSNGVLTLHQLHTKPISVKKKVNGKFKLFMFNSYSNNKHSIQGEF